jgi:hypothetical protein
MGQEAMLDRHSATQVKRIVSRVPSLEESSLFQASLKLRLVEAGFSAKPSRFHQSPYCCVLPAQVALGGLWQLFDWRDGLEYVSFEGLDKES